MARSTQIRRASCIGRRARTGKVLPLGIGLKNRRHILEYATLDKDVAARVNLKGVPRGRVVVPVVVDGVQKGVAGNFGTAAREVVDVVGLEGDEVVGAVEVETPVGVAVARGRVRGRTVEVAVGDCYARVGRGAEDDLLAADLGDL